MFRIGLDLAPLLRARDALAAERAAFRVRVAFATRAEAEGAARRLEQATPRSRLVHPHMQDRWSVIPRGHGFAVVNPAPYALYVAEGTRRMRANPDLARVLADLADNARRDATAALDAPTAP